MLPTSYTIKLKQYDAILRVIVKFNYLKSLICNN